MIRKLTAKWAKKVQNGRKRTSLTMTTPNKIDKLKNLHK